MDKQMSLIDFINENTDWQEALAAAPYFLKVKQKDEYYLLEYDKYASDFTYRIVREARGSIVKWDGEKWVYVCFAMEAFGNVGEDWVDVASVDWEYCTVQEKVDGSLIKIWYDGVWHISTNGTIDAFDAKLNCGEFNSFGDLALAAIRRYMPDEHDFLGRLNRKYCYWFELVSPYNQVVVRYDKVDLYFLGMRNMKSMVELNPMGSVLWQILPHPERFPLYSYAQVKAAADALNQEGCPVEDEGFVVCDNRYHRLKVKSPLYLMSHRFRTGMIGDEGLMDIILIGEDSEVLAYAPELSGRVNDLKAGMAHEQGVAEDVLTSVMNCHPIDKKDCALIAKRYGKYADFVFRSWEAKVHGERYSWTEYTAGWGASKWLKYMRSK